MTPQKPKVVDLQGLEGCKTLAYESKGRGFESRRAHFPGTLKIKGSGVFLCLEDSAVLGIFEQKTHSKTVEKQ